MRLKCLGSLDRFEPFGVFRFEGMGFRSTCTQTPLPCGDNPAATAPKQLSWSEGALPFSSHVVEPIKHHVWLAKTEPRTWATPEPLTGGLSPKTHCVLSWTWGLLQTAGDAVPRSSLPLPRPGCWETTWSGTLRLWVRGGSIWGGSTWWNQSSCRGPLESRMLFLIFLQGVRDVLNSERAADGQACKTPIF